jgi:hypothetical protein
MRRQGGTKHVAGRAQSPGRAVQVDPGLPQVDPESTRLVQRLKLQYGEPLSSFAFNLNLRQYIQVVEAALYDFVFCGGDRHTQNVFIDEVWRCRLIPS